MDRKELHKYAEFVGAVTSKESSNFDFFMLRLKELDAAGINIERLLTAGIGMSAEGGEFNEVIKKMIFQGKEPTAENIFHMKRELGDVMWYWMQSCIALNMDPYDVIEENIRKLKARYPGGEFSIQNSENREHGDL